ncbi:MAG TPA: hypothetical protein DGG95_18315 [Cytophagales bacterium]|jgi:hypothetical protein|nr:hypothetical protein [Cytophagales bacterium]
MWFKWGFKYFTPDKQLEYLREHGVMLGSRVRNERKVFLYIVKNFFVEVVYKNDSIEMDAESLNIFTNLNYLNRYLEEELNSTY